MISLLRYPGGKFYMLEDIKEIFNKSGKTTVIDVFGGSGKVLMNLDAKIKVYNDINNNLVNFFTELRENKEQVLKKMDYILNSRELFERYREKSHDNLENAFRFLYMNITSFNGQGRSYSYSTKRNKSITLVNINKAINKSYNDIKILDHRKTGLQGNNKKIRFREFFLLPGSTISQYYRFV